MRRPFRTIVLLAFTFAGCARTHAPAESPSESPERFRCDALAARAIQAVASSDARTYAEAAAECYAALPPGT